MSKPVPATTESSPLSSVIMRIITDHVRAVKALTGTSANSLDHATLCSTYENAIDLARVLHSSENLTDRFAMLVTENEDLTLKHDATIADCNALTTRVKQLEAQLMQTLTLVTTATNSLPTSRKGQTDTETFTR
jgi:hypothetical protein